MVTSTNVRAPTSRYRWCPWIRQMMAAIILNCRRKNLIRSKFLESENSSRWRVAPSENVVHNLLRDRKTGGKEGCLVYGLNLPKTAELNNEGLHQGTKEPTTPWHDRCKVAVLEESELWNEFRIFTRPRSSTAEYLNSLLNGNQIYRGNQYKNQPVRNFIQRTPSSNTHRGAESSSHLRPPSSNQNSILICSHGFQILLYLSSQVNPVHKTW